MLTTIAFLLAPWLLFFWQMADEFARNPNYQFGLFVPFVVAFLAYERALRAPQAQKATCPRVWNVLAGVGVVAMVFLRLVFEGNADWRLIQWLQGALAVAVTGVGVYLWGGRAYLRHFGWVIVLPLLAIPWPTGVEKMVGTHLMEAIATVGVEVVNMLGHEAARVGNVIYLANGATVGVEEACSGLRSLQGNLLAAGVIGELLNLTGVGRGLMVFLGVAAALIFNFIRSMILVLTAATSGAQAAWMLHDTAGWSILLVSFVVLWGVAQLFPKNVEVAGVGHVGRGNLPKTLAWVGLIVIVASEPLVGAWYPAVAGEPARVVMANPAQMGLTQKVVTADAKKFQDQLFYNEGVSWKYADAQGEWVVFFFNWESARLSRLGGAYHRPERCLPNTGWKILGEHKEIKLKLESGLVLPASITHFTDGQRTATLLFAHWTPEGADMGLDTRLDPAERWSDFWAHKRLHKRQALQVALVGNADEKSAQEALVEFARKVLKN